MNLNQVSIEFLVHAGDGVGQHSQAKKRMVVSAKSYYGAQVIASDITERVDESIAASLRTYASHVADKEAPSGD